MLWLILHIIFFFVVPVCVATIRSLVKKIGFDRVRRDGKDFGDLDKRFHECQARHENRGTIDGPYFAGYVVRGKQNEYVLNGDTCYVDDSGYLRNKEDGRLVHRTIAYFEIYKGSGYEKMFREYQVHHVNHDKLDNHVENLEIVGFDEHVDRHSKPDPSFKQRDDSIRFRRAVAGEKTCYSCFQDTSGYCDRRNDRLTDEKNTTCDAWIGKKSDDGRDGDENGWKRW